MKIAKIIPIYKSGEISKLTNYRPISLVPAFPELVEKLSYDRLLSSINKMAYYTNTNTAFVRIIQQFIR